MRFVYLLIVLGFPVFDLFATVHVARWTGVPAWAWLGLPVQGPGWGIERVWWVEPRQGVRLERVVAGRV